MAGGNILMGVVGKAHGVRGLLRVHSFTADPADLARYNPLIDDRGRAWTIAWKGEGVAELRDADGIAVADRTAAEKLVNLRLHAPRESLPKADDDDFYIADLIGLEAIGGDGTHLGRIAEVHDYGGGTSLEIVPENGAPLLVPFTRICVPVVDIEAGRVTVLPPDEIDMREQAA